MDTAMKTVQPLIDRLRAHLSTSDDVVTQLLAKAESYTNVDRLHILIGSVGSLLLLLLLFNTMPILSSVVGVVYPVWRTFHTIEGAAPEEHTQWLIYWMVFGVLTFVENFADVVLFWFPFYYTFKIAFLGWLMWPGERNGAVVLYDNVIKKVLARADKKVDEATTGKHEMDKGEKLIQKAKSEINRFGDTKLD